MDKPKFVLNSNYVITKDRLPKEIIDKLKAHQARLHKGRMGSIED